MPSYAILRVIGWLMLGALLIGYAITDGFHLGVGAMFRFVGRDEAERSEILASVEPVWKGTSAWLILGAGAVLAALTLRYAAGFLTLYLAILLVLAGFLLRPVGCAFRNRFSDSRWRNSWDWALTMAGGVPALLCGVVFGNLFLGVPFHFDAQLRPIYTGGFLTLFHPFTLLVGIVSLAMLVLHGSSYTALKVRQRVNTRVAATGVLAASTFAIAFFVAGAWVIHRLPGYHITSAACPFNPSTPLAQSVRVMQGGWAWNYQRHPLLWLVPVSTEGSALGAAILLCANQSGKAFLFSAITQAGTVLTGGIALFPFLIASSSHPDLSLTLWGASTSALNLCIRLVALVTCLPIVLPCSTWAYRVVKSAVTREHFQKDSGLY